MTSDASTSRNLLSMYEQADATDYAEGMRAYERYNAVLHWFAAFYNVPFDRTVAAFSALSPNNDYYGNLRSLASVLDGYNKGVPTEAITVATYKACRDRAMTYVTGEADFLATVKGLKTRAFYCNLMKPDCSEHACIDGHMKAAYLGKNLTMKQAIVRSRTEYRTIEGEVKKLALDLGILPCQFQAIVWLTRKRVYNVKYQPQLDLFRDPADRSGILVTPQEAPPYTSNGVNHG